MVNEFLEVFIQYYCQHGIPSMFYICEVWKIIGCRYVRQPNVFIDAFFYTKIHLHQLGQFKLIITTLKYLHVL